MSGEGSPCHEESYVIVFDGAANEKIMKGDDQRMFAEMMHGFHRTHQSDYKAMVKGVRKKGVLKWVAGDKGNVIFDTLCVAEDAGLEQAEAADPVKRAAKQDKPAPAKAAAKQDKPAPVKRAAKQDKPAPAKAAANQARAVQAPARMNLVNQAMTGKDLLVANPTSQPALPELQACKKKQPYYLRPATPGMARQLGSAKTRAFVNGGRLPGQGSCGNYCVSRLSSTSLSAIDIAKSRALAQFL